MSQILVLLRKSLLNFTRARAAVVITFVVPIVLVFILGHVFGVTRRDSTPEGIPVGVVVESTDPAAADLVNALKGEKTLSVITTTKGADGVEHPLTEAAARAAMHDNKYRFTLILPADLLADDRFGIHLKVLTNPRNETENQIVTGMLQKTIFSKVPHLMGASLQRSAKRYLGSDRLQQFNHGIAENIAGAFGGNTQDIQRRIESGSFLGTALPANTAATTGAASSASSSTADSDLLSRLVKIDTDQIAGKEVKNPMAARIVAGYAIMFLLFAVSGSASSMFEEKATGIFQRLLSSPVTPSHIIWARFCFGIILGIVQITALFAAGRFFFGLDITHNVAALAVITVAAAAACSAFGVLIAALSPSAEAARGLSTFVVITMSALGGAWFPVSLMPAYIQTISKLTIVYWSVEGMTDVLWAGYGLTAVLSKAAILAAIAAVVMVVSIQLFKRNRFFE